MSIESVVIVGPSMGSYPESIARGFRQNGVKATSFSYPEPAVGIQELAAWELLPRLGLTAFRTRWMDQVVRRVSEACQDAQLLILVKADSIPLAQYAALLGGVRCPKILWLMDSVHGVKEGMERARLVDGVLYFEGTDSSSLSALPVPVHHVALAADPTWYRPLDGARIRWDFSFIGTLYGDRLWSLESILRELPPDVRSAGRLVGSFRSYVHPVQTARRMSSYPLTAKYLKHGAHWTHDQINRLNNQSRICLNILHPQSIDSLNMRAFETCSSGAFLLCQANKLLSRCFELGKEAESFETPREAAEKILFYLRRPSEAEAIAAAGRQRVLRDHTMQVRTGQILQIARDDFQL